MNQARPNFSAATTLAQRAAAALLLIVVSACGGGGSSTPTNTMQTQAAKTWQALLAGGRTVVVSGPGYNGETLTDDVLEQTLTFEQPVRAPSPIDGTSQWSLRITASNRWMSNPTHVTSGWIEYDFDSSFKMLGHHSGDGCDVVSSSATPPALVNLGDAGTLSQPMRGVACFGQASPPITAYAEKWSIQIDGPTMFFCLRTDRYYVDPTPWESQELCLEVAADGTIGQKVRVRYPGATFPITLRNY